MNGGTDRQLTFSGVAYDFHDKHCDLLILYLEKDKYTDEYVYGRILSNQLAKKNTWRIPTCQRQIEQGAELGNRA